MLPFIQIASFRLPTYGPMMCIAFLVGIALASRRAPSYGIVSGRVVDMLIYGLVGGLIGAKLLYIVPRIPELWQARAALTLSDIGSLIGAGFVFYGGLIGGCLGAYIYCRQYHFSFLTMGDITAPSLSLGHAIGRLGCFLAGCCYGRPMAPPLGMTFRADSFAPLGVSVLPTQLIEAGMDILLTLLLLALSKRLKRSGQLFGVYLAGYALLRFSIEFLRGDPERLLYFGVSTSQWIALALLPIGLYLILRRGKNAEPTKKDV